MRVLAIRGENLASLDGAFEVDLAGEPLGRVGLFAITGPTGSGKSTLLDALCLALYDTTPRLDGRGGEEVGAADGPPELRIRAQDVRGLLRRGRGAGSAEVDFVGADGGRYRATWSVRRARGRADGRLQAQEMTLVDLDADPERPLCRTKSDTLAAIEARVGLSFAQFRRSVLLAQGDFAAFLLASSDERAGLLERMTGTEVYGDLSRAAYRRARDERSRLKDLERRIEARETLGPEARAALEAQVVEARAAQKAVSGRCEAVRARLRSDEAVRKAERDLVAARRGVTDAETTQEAARSERAAAHLRHLCALAERAAASAGRVDAAVRTADAARSEIEATDVWRDEHPTELALAEVWPACEEPLDVLARTEERLPTLREEAAALAAALVPLEGALAEAEASVEAALAGCAAAEDHVRRAAAGTDEPGLFAGASLDERLVTAEARFEWLSARETAARRGAERSKATEEQQRLEAARATALEALVVADLALAAAERSRRSVEAALDLAGHRADLVDGEACPLCGAEEHPWSTDAPRLEALDAVREAESTARSHRGEKAAAVAESDGRIASLVERVEQIDRELAAAAENETAALAAWQATRPAGDFEATAPESTTLEAARAEITGLRERRKQVAEAREALDTARNGERATRDARDAAERCLRDARERAVTARQAVEAMESRREEARGGLLPKVGGFVREDDEAAADWRQRLEGIVAVVRTRTERRVTLVEQLGSLDVACTEARSALSRDRAALAAAVSSYAQPAPDVETSTGTDDELAEAVMLAAELVADAERAVRRADVGASTARALAKEASDGVVAAREAVHPAPEDGRLAAAWADPEALAQLHAELTGELESAQMARERVAGELHADDEARAAAAALGRELAEARESSEVWLRLADLIGSSDGQVFRRFAQGLTLDVLLREANHQLVDLAPRYALERVPGEDLALQVVDRDLGDEIRSVRSLSGGESFLVSLALALGLASMASQRAPVDSLFIDEGFGTLDPESLDIAISALDALQASGRQVGVISHVPGLAEQIGVQVRVEKHGGGRSVVRVTAPAVAGG